MPSSRPYTISKRRQNLALGAASAERLIRLEREMLTIRLYDKGSQPHHFRAVISDLPQKREAAAEAISMLRNFVGRERELGPIVEKLCAESQQSAARREAQPQARRILLWVPGILEWLQKNQEIAQRRPSALALEFVAHDYGVKSWLVQRAMSGPATDPNTIRAIINATFAACRRRGNEGARPTPK